MMIRVPQEMELITVSKAYKDEIRAISYIRVNAVTIGEICRSKREVTLYASGLNFKDTQPIVRHFLRQFYYELYDHKELGLILGCIDTGHVMVIKESVTFQY